MSDSASGSRSFRRVRGALVAVGVTTAWLLELSCRAEPSPEKAPPPPVAPTAAPEPLRDDQSQHVYVVAAIGDSLTDTRVHGGLYLKYLQERCPKSRFDSYGKGGEMVNQMRRRFAADILGIGAPLDPAKPKYTHVIVFGGVNDLYSDLTAGRTVAKITKDLAAMYDAAHERGLKVVALTVTPWGGFHRYYDASRAVTTGQLNDWIMAQPVAKTVDYAVDAHPLLSCGDPESLCDRYAAPFRDGLHFGPEGHKRLSEALYRNVFSDCS